jgi:hypothetical protein
MTYDEPLTGYCPEIDDEREITVTFNERTLMGHKSSERKATGFMCEDAAWGKCKFIKEHGENSCPLCNSAR